MLFKVILKYIVLWIIILICRYIEINLYQPNRILLNIAITSICSLPILYAIYIAYCDGANIAINKMKKELIKIKDKN